MPPFLHRPFVRSLRVAVLIAICLMQVVGGKVPAAPDSHKAEPLAVAFERTSPVFSPQEVLRLTATVPARKTAEGRENGIPRLEWQVVPIGGTKSIDAGDFRFEPAGQGLPTDVGVELTLPKDEGAYTLHLAAHGRRVAKSERTIQFVVIKAERPAELELRPTANKLVDSFDPATGGLLRKVSLDTTGKKQNSPLARLLRFSRQEGDSKAVALADQNAMAYRLKVAHPGRPHLVEIICPSNRAQSGSVCLVEGDAQGHFVQLGPECSFLIGPTADGSGSQIGPPVEAAVHRQIFWPNEREPALVVVGRQAGRPLDVNRIQLYELGDRLVHSDAGEPREAPSEERPSVRSRLVGPYLRQIDLPRNFCGPRSNESDRSDDWQTHLLAGSRLTDYLLYQKQNALLLALPAELTTTISRQLAEGSGPTVEMQNPSSIDVLEMLLRLFDREGLTLIPELQFDGPLEFPSGTEKPENSASEIELTDSSGRLHSAADPALAAGAPLYSPLSGRVQEAVLSVVGDFLKRYAGHPSFGGVAFRLGPRSCLQFPGIEWGYDSDSIRRFELSSQVRVPRSEGADASTAAYRFLTTTARRDWLRFRSGEIASFHRRLAELVVESGPELRVIFAGPLTPAFESDAAAAVVGVVRAGINPARMLAEQGLDFLLPPYSSDPHVTVLRPVVRLDAHDQSAQGAAASLNLSPAIDALYRGTNPGGLLQLLARKSDMPLFHSPDGLPWGMVPATSGSASDRAADGLYSQLLATLDAQIFFDGAGVTALVPAVPAQRLPTAIARLPNVAFRPAGPQIQPVVVRSALLESSTWIYAVNASSLPVSAEMVLDCPATTAARPLIDGDQPVLVAVPGNKSRVRIELPGNGLWGVRLDRPAVSVSETQVTVADEGLVEFKQRIELLNTNMKVAALASTKPTSHAVRRPVESQETRQAGWEATARQPDSLNGDEVRQLTKTVSSVKLAWEEGRYADCQRMLDGYWGQLLLSMPVETPPVSPAKTKLTGRLRDKLKR